MSLYPKEEEQPEYDGMVGWAWLMFLAAIVFANWWVQWTRDANMRWHP